jgi:UDP-2-acetamido-3-amino-2,3-dideoxy-glucuronate N-acetyltransferase
MKFTINWKRFFSLKSQTLTLTKIHPTAEIAGDSEIGEGTWVWHFSQILNKTRIGENCRIGRYVYIDNEVRIGHNCKIQNNATLYSPAKLEDGVFIGPGVIFTNDHHPRAVNIDGTLKKNSDWESEGVNVGTGASIGAGAICVAPVKIGKWAMVAAGAVVASDVKDYALVVGIPAKQIGWVGEAGLRLQAAEDGSGLLVCPMTKKLYTLQDGKINEII